MLDLCVGTQTDVRASLLSVASRALPHPDVLRRWIQVAQAEPDRDLFAAMLRRLSHLDPRQLGDVQPLLALLSKRQDDASGVALRLLSRLVLVGGDAVLMGMYDEHPAARRRIVSALCRMEVPSPTVAAFLRSILGTLDADLRSLALNRCLQVDQIGPEGVERLLDAAQPTAVKGQVLEFMADRGWPPSDAVYRILRQDPDDVCRIAAVRCIERAPDASGARRALLAALAEERAESVMLAVLQALSRTQNPDADWIEAMTKALERASSKAVTSALLAILRPHGAKVRPALLTLLSRSLQASVAHDVCHLLGDDVPLMLAAWDAARDDHVRTAILEAASAWADPRLWTLYERALDTPLRNWAVRGLLTLPMSPQEAPRLARAAPVLLDPRLGRELKLALAQRLVRLPHPPISTFRDLVRQTEDGELKDMLHKVLASGPPEVDFDTWLRRVQVEHDVRGVFPHVYVAWDRDPVAAFAILKTVLLDERCRDSMYACRVWDMQILQFLAVRGRVDDDMSRYCIHRAAHVDGNASHLAMLKANPTFVGLRHGMWELMSSTRMRNWNTVLMRELLVLAWGSDDAAAVALEARLLDATTPAAAFPILHVLCDRNIGWGPTLALLKTARTRPVILDKTNHDLIAGALQRMHLEDEPSERKPGLADDE